MLLAKIFAPFLILCGVKIIYADSAAINSTNSSKLQLFFNASKGSTKNESGRGLYGLLGFLTGFRLGQGLGPTSYSSDIRESSQLNLFAKLFNGALYLTFGRYPYPYQFSLQSPSYPPLPDNIFPTGLQPPIWYPPNLNPIVLPQGHNPINQQQIVNIHEPFNPNEAPNENYQEINDHNSQQIHNNFQSDTSMIDGVLLKNSSDAAEYIDAKNSIQNTTCDQFNSTCIDAIESDFEDINETLEVQASDQSGTKISGNDTISTTTRTETIDNIALVNSTNLDKTMASNLKEHNTTKTKPDDSSSGTPSTWNGSHNLPHDTSIHSYPYSYYHYYSNGSQYEHISITENPNSNTDFLKQSDIYADDSYESYLPKIEDPKTPFFTEHENYETFRPMIGNYYQNYDPENLNKFNTRQEESQFVPMEGSNRL